MRTSRVHRLGVWLLPAIVWFSAVPAWGAQWWNGAWPVRRLLTLVDHKVTGLPGDDVAVATFPTAGFTKADGSDIRVATGTGIEMPCRVLMMGPGDRARVAFAIRPGTKQYYAYMGHKNPVPRQDLAIQRGVLLESWECDKVARTLEEAQRLLEKNLPRVGSDFRDRIFLGHNPFDRRHDLLNLYTAYLVAPMNGDYLFACSSQNGSFVCIDDKLVLKNGGQHPPQHDVGRLGPVGEGRQAKITLKAGLHKISFYHTNARGLPYAVLAWQTPGGSRIGVIPESAFARVEGTIVGPLEEGGKEATLDFIPVHAGESWVGERYFQRFAFVATAGGKAIQGVEWEFGDGTHGRQQNESHVYLLDGNYIVTLTAKMPGGQQVRTNRIYVDRDGDRSLRNELESLRSHCDIVGGYDFTALTSPQANATAVWLLSEAHNEKGVIRAGEAFMARPAAGVGSLRETVDLYADALIARGRPGKAVEAMLRGAEMSRDPNVQAAMTYRAGRIALDDLLDAQMAMGLFLEVTRKYEKIRSPVLRRARIGIGDCYRQGGDYQKAKAAYERAGIDGSMPRKIEIFRGDYARHVEEQIRIKEFEFAREFLTRWEEAIPTDKIEGYSTMLKIRLYMAQARYAEAVAEAQTIVAVNPTNIYAPQCLLLQAQSYERLSQPDLAKKVYRRIVEQYPESPLALDAAKYISGEATPPPAPIPTPQAPATHAPVKVKPSRK